MDLDGTNARFSISVDDISDVWGTLKPVLESRTAWRNLQLRNRVGGSVSVAELQVRYVLSNNARLAQLRQHSQSPVTWFRNPYVHLILISSDDADGYKRGLRNQLRQAIDANADLLGGAPEFVIACLQPFASDVNAKAARKVFDMVRSDIGTRKRDRVVRMEVGPRGAVSIASVNDLERQMAEALKVTFSVRQAAYDEAVRKLSSERQTAGWDFGNLFLVKDSLAVMLESAGLLEDALREYAELDALYNTTLPPLDSPNAPPFGASAPGDDTAQLVRATWKEARKTVWRNNELLQFDFQQFLFACQARILLKLNRPAEVVERGIAAIESLQAAMEHPAISEKLPPLFKEAWTFSACISLATTTVRIGPPPPTPKSQTTLHTRYPSQPTINHRRTISELPRDQKGSMKAYSRQTKSLNATDFATISEGSTGEGSTKSDEKSEAESDEESEGEHRRLQSKDRGISLESSTERQRARLKPVKIRTPDPPSSIAGGSPNGQARHLPDQSISSTPQSAVSLEPSTDWQLGVNGYLSAEFLTEAESGVPVSEAEKGSKQRHFWSLLGHLYTRARDALSAFDDSVEAMEYQPSVVSSPQGHISEDMQGSSTPINQSPLSLGSPTLLGPSPSKGHILASLDGTSMGSRNPSSSNLAADAARASAAPKVELTTSKASNGGSAPHGAQHFRTLSRFAREAGLRTTSASSLFHHARRGSTVSDAASTAASEAESVGSLLRDSDPSAPQAEVLLRNVRVVEREVETASESSGSPSSAKLSERSSAFKSKFSWLTEWRLRLALTSQANFQELWIDLSGAAALSFFSAGWKRQAHLMMAEVGEVLVQKGQLQAAISLLHNCIRQLVAESWLDLSGRLMRLQLQCHRRLNQVAEPRDCFQLLGLLQPHSSQNDLKSELLSTFLDSIHCPSKAEQESLCNPTLVWAQPVGTHYSRFFGRTQAEREPMMAASVMPPCKGIMAGTGACQACVGDIVSVPVLITSHLPAPIPISQCQLSLSILQEVMAVRSPSGGGGTETAFTRSQGHLRSMSLRSVSMLATPIDASKLASSKASHNASAASIAELATPSLTNSEMSEAQKLYWRWQEAEAVSCQLAQSRGVPSKSGTMEPEVIDSEGAQLLLQPGQNLFTFQVTPLKQGLYALKHCTFQVGHLKVRVPVCIDAQGAAMTPTPAGRPAKGVLGSCNTSGKLEEEAVVVHVKKTAQRVSTSALLPNSAVIADARQWVGVAVKPMHDLLEDAHVQVRPSPPGSATPGAPEQIGLLHQNDRKAFISPLLEKQGSEGRYPWQASEASQPSTSGRPGGSLGQPQSVSWRGRAGDLEALPAWASTQPSVIWLPLQAGRLKAGLEKVRVSPYSSQVPLRSLSKAAGEISSPLTSPLRSPDGEPRKPSQPPQASAHMDINLEYNAGCPRGSSSRLVLPVLPPLRVHVTGKELPGNGVVLQVSLTSNLATPLTLHSYNLKAQPGFSPAPGQPSVSTLLPLQIPPEGAASLLLFLSVVDTHSEDPLGKRASRLQSSIDFIIKTSLDRPPSTAYREQSSLDANDQQHREEEEEEQVLTQQHSFLLDLGAANAAPLSTVYIRLLGPFSAKVGEAATFCWRLERSASFVASKGETDVLQYTIKLEGDSRRASQEWQGQIRLPLKAGSIATVEATWIPQAAGMLAMPQFMLPDVPHQEVFDIGDPSFANHSLTVS